MGELLLFLVVVYGRYAGWDAHGHEDRESLDPGDAAVVVVRGHCFNNF